MSKNYCIIFWHTYWHKVVNYILMRPSIKLNNRIMQLIGLVLLGIVVFYGQSILVPIGFSFILSITLLPVYRLIRRTRLPDSISILLTLVFAFIVLGVIIGIISIELSNLLSNTDSLEKNITAHLKEISLWIQSKTGYGIKQQSNFLNQQVASLKSAGGNIVSGTASSLGIILLWFGLVPIYVFLILYYKNLLLRFIFLSTNPNYHETAEASIHETESTLKNYFNGLMIEMAIVFTLITVTLLIFGVKYAVLIAAVFGVLNMIPYIGALIANILAVLITLSTSANLSHTWTVLIVIAVVQFIDNNIIMIYVVSSKVKINGLVTIIAVVIGEALAGIGGMFLAIPLVAVLKVIFDKIDSMKYWGMLFGDDKPKLNPLSNPVMRLRKKFTKKEIEVNQAVGE